MGFGALLRARRRAAGLSQQELAERAGLSIRTIGNLERGASKWPYRDSVHRLADALGLRDEARAEFIAAAGRRLAAGSGPGRRPACRAPGSAARAGSVAAHLPAAVPAFVGRRGQLAALSQVLQQPGGTAVITAIGGTAGVGKTALAVHWAHQVAGEFPDGQLYVNLRGFDPSGTPVRRTRPSGCCLTPSTSRPSGGPRRSRPGWACTAACLPGNGCWCCLTTPGTRHRCGRCCLAPPPAVSSSPAATSSAGLVATEAPARCMLDVLTDAEASELLSSASALTGSPLTPARRPGSSLVRAPPARVVRHRRPGGHAAGPVPREIAAELAASPDLDAFPTK